MSVRGVWVRWFRFGVGFSGFGFIFGSWLGLGFARVSPRILGLMF